MNMKSKKEIENMRIMTAVKELMVLMMILFMGLNTIVFIESVSSQNKAWESFNRILRESTVPLYEVLNE